MMMEIYLTLGYWGTLKPCLSLSKSGDLSIDRPETKSPSISCIHGRQRGQPT